MAVQTSQISYFVGANADNSGTYNYDLGVFNSSGNLVLNLSGGSLHGSTFAAATGRNHIVMDTGIDVAAAGGLLPGLLQQQYDGDSSDSVWVGRECAGVLQGGEREFGGAGE